MINKLRPLAVALLLAAGTGVAGAATASAQNCPYTSMCGWGDRYYVTGGNGYAYVKASQCFSNLSGVKYEGTGRIANDDITSVFNNGGSSNAHYFTAAGYSGSSLYVARGTGYDQLNAQAPTFDNTISSFKFDPYPNSCV